MRGIAVVLVAVLAGIGVADEYDDLVGQLRTDPEQATRRLTAAGAAALPALFRHVEHDQLEVRRRVAMLLGAQDWTDPTRKVFLERRLEAIRAGRDRGRAIVQLLACGPTGRARMERLLRQDGQLVCRLVPDRTSVTPGDLFTVRARVANAGPGGLWVWEQSAHSFPSIRKHFQPFRRFQATIWLPRWPYHVGGAGGTFGGRRGGKLNLARKPDESDPLFGYRWLGPGEALDRISERRRFARGRRARTPSSCACPRRRRGRTRCDGTASRWG